MSIDKINKILAIPKIIYKPGTKEEWSNVENKIGISLPSDYKQFINTYGTGKIDNFIWILTPFVKDENLNLLERSKFLIDNYLKTAKKFPQYYKHKVYPEDEGLFPWGYTINGDILYWITKRKSNDWNIVVYESRSSENYEYEGTMTHFLYRLLTREIIDPILTDEDFPTEKLEFVAYDIE